MSKNGCKNCVCGSFDACQIRTGLVLLGCLYYLVGETDFHFLYNETDYYIEMIKLLYTDEELTLQLVIQSVTKKNLHRGKRCQTC